MFIVVQCSRRGAKFLAVTGSARLQRARHTTRPATPFYQHDSDAGLAEFMAKLQSVLIGSVTR